MKHLLECSLTIWILKTYFKLSFPFSRMEPSYVVKMKFLILPMAVQSKLIRYIAEINNFKYFTFLSYSTSLLYLSISSFSLSVILIGRITLLVLHCLQELSVSFTCQAREAICYMRLVLFRCFPLKHGISMDS